jgi:flagellar hook-associated protein 2
LAAGTYTFNIQSGGNNTSVSFEANSGDSNQDVLSNMASAINSAKTGVTASVATNSTNGTSQLNITANNTGTDSAFSITDVTGNAANYTGANNVTGAASNAEYSVDGNFNSSQSNTTDIDDSNVSLTFSGTVSDAEVAVGSDNNVSADSVNNFVTAYNNLVSFAASNSQYISSNALNELNQGVQNQASDLQSIGITQNYDGTLGVNQDTLSSSIANNSGAVASAKTGAGGLASNTFSATQNIVNNSLSNYASELTTASNESSTFYNFIGAENTSNLWSALGQNLTTTA